MNTQPTQTPLITRLTAYLPMAEKIFLMGVAIGIVLTLANLDSLVLKASLVGLAATFFLYAYKPIDVPVQDGDRLGFTELLGYMIVPKVTWISCSVSTMGILFTMQNFKGAKQMLSIGEATLGIALLIIIFLVATGVKYMSVVVPVLYRAIPLLIFDLYLFFK